MENENFVEKEMEIIIDEYFNVVIMIYITDVSVAFFFQCKTSY